jgi:hypothetical protein
MAYAADEAASAVRTEADQAVRVALQEVHQRNEEVENARLGAEYTAQQAMEMQAAAVRAAEEHVAQVRPMLAQLVVRMKRSFADRWELFVLRQSSMYRKQCELGIVLPSRMWRKRFGICVLGKRL